MEIEPEVRSWLAALPDRDFGRAERRVILLTVFRKSRSAETGEVARALQAQKLCESTHGTAHEVLDREVT